MPMPMQSNMAPLLSMLTAGGGGSMAPLMSMFGGGAMGSAMGGGAAAGAGGMDWETLMRMLSSGGIPGLGGETGFSGGGGVVGGNGFARTPANNGGAFTMPGGNMGAGMGTAPLQSIMAARQNPMANIINRMMQFR